MDDVEPSLDHFKNVLVAGGDIEDPDDGRTALVRACIWPDSSMVRLLLELGANIHVRDKYGRQPLHYAAMRCERGSPTVCSPTERTKVIKLLLDAGAILEAKDDGYDTPLSWAYTGGCASSVRFLLDAGANPNTYGKLGCPPILCRDIYIYTSIDEGGNCGII